MITRFPAFIVAFAVMFALVLAACDGSDGGTSAPGDDPFVLDDGESLGNIERIAGGTAVPSDTRTLTSIACSAGEVVINTSSERIRGDMDCDRMFPADVLNAFIGKAVAIRADAGRLIVENETAGTLEFPVDEPALEPLDAAP